MSENGLVTFQVQNMIFWAPSAREPGHGGRHPRHDVGLLLIVGRGAAAGPEGRELPGDLRHASVAVGVEYLHCWHSPASCVNDAGRCSSTVTAPGNQGLRKGAA